MGHARPSTTLAIYTHLFNTDDHADAMAALEAYGIGAGRWGERHTAARLGIRTGVFVVTPNQ